MKTVLPVLLCFLFYSQLLLAQPPADFKTYSIEEFYKTTRVYGGNFSDNEEKLLVSSDESGIFNVFEITIADGSKQQLTFSDKESFFANDYVPGTGDFLYSADKGGNEISHIYLKKQDGTVQDLTPGEKEKANFAGWSDDDKFMYYITNQRDPKYFDMYKMVVGQWNPILVYQNDNGLNIDDLSEDESKVVLSQTITTSENKLFLVNNGEQIELSTEVGSYSSAGFSKNNQYLYYTTNAGKDFAYLMEYDIAAKTKKVIYETNWDVMYSYLSKKETYRVIGVNEDGKNTIIIRDTKTGKAIDFPSIPDGDITGLRISDSEQNVRLSVGTSKSSNNIYLYNFVDKKLSKLTDSQNPKIDPDHLVSAEVVRYKSFDGLEIPAIYYKPLAATKDQKVPALVWVHGGPGGQSRVGYSALIQYLVNHGYAVLAVNNRGSSGYGNAFYTMDDLNHGDKDLKDCIWGKKWLQEQDYVDNEKIGIIGGSYGGYMTMAAMTFTPDEFKTGVNIFGVTNWLRTLKSIPPYWESFRNALYKEIGDPNTQDSVRLYNISPVFHADKVKNPVMVLQGANDPRVLQIESDEIVAGIKKNNVPVEYVIFPDEGHGFRKKENEIKGYSQILAFLDKYLKADVGFKN